MNDIEQFLSRVYCTPHACLYGGIESIEMMYKTLHWYREQELIPRAEPIELIRTAKGIPSAGAKVRLMYKIGQIPKAEPPHATVDERNGDCETCKHYTAATMYDCANDCKYEPYKPR